MYYLILSAAQAYGPALALITAVSVLFRIVLRAFRGGY